MVAACTVTTIIVMTFRLPYAFLGIFYAFVISRQRPEWLIRNGFAAVAASAAAVVYVAVGVQLLYDYQVLRLVFLAFTLYLVFYLKRALTNDSVTFAFGVTATVALTLIWDRPYPAEAHLAATFSLSFVVALGTAVAMAVAWVTLQLHATREAGNPDSVPATRSSQPLLVADAFSNQEHARFALKGCLAGLLCYIVDSSVAWPVIWALVRKPALCLRGRCQRDPGHAMRDCSSALRRSCWGESFLRSARTDCFFRSWTP